MAKVYIISWEYDIEYVFSSSKKVINKIMDLINGDFSMMSRGTNYERVPINGAILKQLVAAGDTINFFEDDDDWIYKLTLMNVQ